MIKSTLLAVSAIVAISAHSYLHGSPSASHRAASSTDFHWTGTVPAGSWLRVRNLAGNVEVRQARGNTVDVTATREPDADRWFWNAPIEPVHFIAQNRGSDVLVCAESKSVPGCDPDDINSPDGAMNWRPQPMHVVVELPAGVSIQSATTHGDLLLADVRGAVLARTGHGQISIHDVSGTVNASSGHGDLAITNAAAQVSANTGHGDISVSSNGAVRANTGHGDITATLGSNAALDSGDLMFSTGHGNVNVRAPGNLTGDVDLHTGRGGVSTSFPLTMDDGRNSRSESARGVLGASHRVVKLESGHGDISLTRGG